MTTPIRHRARSKPKRRFMVISIAVVLFGVACIVAALVLNATTGFASAAASAPVPKIHKVPTATRSTTPTPTPTPTPSIAPGNVTALYLPPVSAAAADTGISTNVQPMVQQGSSIATGDCPNIIEPTEASIAVERTVYQCVTNSANPNSGYVSPSTNITGMVVLAGHSSVNRNWQTAFDNLSCTATGCGPYPPAQACSVEQGQGGLIGRMVYLKTATSGNSWFSYKVTAVECPTKATTPQNTALKQAIWTPTDGKLLLVTCLEQVGYNKGAISNLFVIAQYQEVTQTTP